MGVFVSIGNNASVFRVLDVGYWRCSYESLCPSTRLQGAKSQMTTVKIITALIVSNVIKVTLLLRLLKFTS
jgi:hypothetical protein